MGLEDPYEDIRGTILDDDENTPEYTSFIDKYINRTKTDSVSY
jgi:hypothetical protein